MSKVPHGVKILPKISIAWVGRTNVTDDRRQTTDRRQTDGRRHIANLNLSSRSLKIICRFKSSIPTLLSRCPTVIIFVFAESVILTQWHASCFFFFFSICGVLWLFLPVTRPTTQCRWRNPSPLTFDCLPIGCLQYSPALPCARPGPSPCVCWGTFIWLRLWYMHNTSISSDIHCLCVSCAVRSGYCFLQASARVLSVSQDVCLSVGAKTEGLLIKNWCSKRCEDETIYLRQGVSGQSSKHQQRLVS